MASFKLQHLLPEVVADFRAILQAVCKPEELPATVAGLSLPQAWQLLSILSRNRAYDDNHPAFVANKWQRILPFDGRKYCFYYENGATDEHVATLLRNAVKALQATP